ncbi:type II toxin-antitoxin system RelE/ParE family toxin [Flammeovirga yaeyamensis]|uniref:Type II toxin-antitoxin system RelE/ParE family toxin n=1 Tax=Flammeovirga yaeyamensis TaxID=367791 RepID=A0AAX1N7K8_9BACT|nr:type II toxin-antitoxin system RelE/ParE family toxin [Flammeovirga yaeyamensis]MBB3697792.1 putative addiction module killer protein [Flammeovirga yaeyamensis]NMF35852.1 type II toxin-antitoxin system RelE/ParE family toxin [Flammeovirga yaeyamensis]QWG03197.1 type II toxin-antitoxin system RelE/ParE family toxin [Flammeovirga yaeyamensis]
MEIKETKSFSNWFKKLKKKRRFAAYEIMKRLNRVKNRNLCDCKAIGKGIHELRIHFEKGYRIYFTYVNGQIILLLAGGDKTTQREDIIKSKKILNSIK